MVPSQLLCLIFSRCVTPYNIIIIVINIVIMISKISIIIIAVKCIAIEFTKLVLHSSREI
jgi:hypothetical protein